MAEINISSENMQEYMNKVFNSNFFREYIGKSSILGDSAFHELGNLLAKYYISTGDNSIESARTIVDEYASAEDKDEYKQTQYLKRIEISVSKILTKDRNNIADRIEILNYIYLRNKVNQFYTHCFPGALYEEVSENGLDISKEFFLEELSILTQNDGNLRSSFKTGKLCYCELSSASLSYAIKGLPERVSYAIGGIDEKYVSECSSFYDLTMKSFESYLEKYKNNPEKYEIMYSAGIKLINFYCKNSNACVAIFKDKNPIDVSSNFISKILERDLPTIISKAIDNFGLKNTTIEEIFIEGRKKAKEEHQNTFEIYDEIIRKIKEYIPESADVLNQEIDNTFYHNMRKSAIKNLEYGGMADGYEVPSGKMERTEFEIVRFERPYDMYFDYPQESKRPKENQKNKKSQAPKRKDSKINDTISIIKELANGKVKPQKIERISYNIDGKNTKYIFVVSYEDCIICMKSNGKEINITEVTEDSFTISETKLRLESEMLRGMRDNIPHNEYESIIKLYRESSEYEDYETEEDKEEFEEEDAINWYSKKQLEQLSKHEKENLKNKIINSGTKIKFIKTEYGYVPIDFDGYEVGSCEVVYDVEDEKSSYRMMFDEIWKKSEHVKEKLGFEIYSENTRSVYMKPKDLINDYKKAEINQEDLDKAYENVSREFNRDEKNNKQSNDEKKLE